MMKRLLKAQMRTLLLRLARWAGTEIIDQRTGQPAGRALLVPWRGKVIVFGLDGPLQPVFLPEERVRHWRQFIGFSSHPPPDFPHEPRP
jgi:hypothetical protein